MRLRHSKEQVENLNIISKCMQYVQKSEQKNVCRDHDIERCIEDYLSDRQNYFYEHLDEINQYPAALLKKIVNYKLNYDDELAVAQREIIQLYKSGATDPLQMLTNLRNNKDREEEEDDLSQCNDEEAKEHKDGLKSYFRPPNLSCFQKKKNAKE